MLTWYYNRSIASKLLLGFLGVALLVIGAGAIGYRATANMSHNAVQMYDQQFVPLSIISRITESYQRTRVYAQNFIIIDDENEHKKMWKTVQEIYARMDSLSAEYGKLVPADDHNSAALLKKFNDSLAYFKSTYAEIMAMARRGEKDSAIHYYRHGLGSVSARGMYAMINHLTNANLVLAQQAKENSLREFYFVQMMLTGFTVLALLVAVGIGIGVARTIGAPIRELESAAERVASGDTAIRALCVSFDDEIGSLGRSFNTMV